MSVNMLPTFLIIGAQKSATRWLRVNLGKHPEVFVAPRELEFFNHNLSRGGGWYLEQFRGWNGEPEVGEATPGYMMWRESPRLIAARIDGALPKAKLLAILRNPIDRAHSAFVHHVMMGRIPPEMSVLGYVERHPPEEDPLGIIAGGWYGASLAPYVRRFGHRLRVLVHEEITNDPARVYSDALAHLGVDDEFRPDDLDAVLFSHLALADGANPGSENRRPLTADERGRLKEAFVDDLNDLAKIVALNLAPWAEDFSDLDSPSRNAANPLLHP